MMLDIKETGLNIYKILEEKGMSVKRLSRWTGIRETTIYTWLRGESIPRLDHALAIAKALKCSVYDLVVMK